MEERVATRWIVRLARRFAPQLGFLWDRVTPGGTFGLEFTTLMATLAVVAVRPHRLHRDRQRRPGPDPRRHHRLRIRRRIQAEWLIHLAKVVTALGSPAVVFPLAAIAAAFWPGAREGRVRGAGRRHAADRGRRTPTQGRDRPAPPEGGLVDASGSSFPSAHAVYSTFYVWLSLTVACASAPGGRGAPGDRAGIVIVALIGLSRVYLGSPLPQ